MSRIDSFDRRIHECQIQLAFTTVSQPLSQDPADLVEYAAGSLGTWSGAPRKLRRTTWSPRSSATSARSRTSDEYERVHGGRLGQGGWSKFGGVRLDQ